MAIGPSVLDAVREVLTQEQTLSRRPQAVAERKLAQVRKRIDAARRRHLAETKKAARTARLIQSLERSAAHYAKRASLTDAEIEAERLARRERMPKRRGMDL